MTEKEAIKEIKRWTNILMNAGSQCVTETAEAQNMAISALEKQIAKKAIPTPEHCYYAFKCPVCDRHYEWSLRHEFCDCGQRLDWSKIKIW